MALLTLVAIGILAVSGWGHAFDSLAAELLGLQALQLSRVAPGTNWPAVGPSGLFGRVPTLARLMAARPAGGAPATPEMRAFLRGLTVPGAWGAETATVDRAVSDAETRWSIAGVDPAVNAIARQMPPAVAAVLAEHKFAVIDPALARYWAQQDVLPPYARSVDRFALSLMQLGESWLAAARWDDAALAYGAAIATLNDCAASSRFAPLALVAAQNLPRACRGLAKVADEQGNASWADQLRRAAGDWDRVSATWRAAVSGPPNLLPNTGTAAYHPDEHRSALVSLARVGIILAALCLYAIILVAVLFTGLIRVVLRRPGKTVRWATGGFGWISSSAALLVPTVAAMALLSLAGDDWSWLSSFRLIVAVLLLVAIGHLTILSLAMRLLFRREGDTRSPRADWLAAVGRLLPLLLATAVAFLFVLKPPADRRVAIPPLVYFTVVLAWAWLAAAAALVAAAGLWHVADAIRSVGSPRARLSGAGACTPLLAMAALGFFIHAALLPPALRWNQAIFRAHSQKVADTLTDEPAARLGAAWRTRLTAGSADLLAPLRGRP